MVLISKFRINTMVIRVRRLRLSDKQTREFDAIAVCGEYLLINETKSRLRPEDVTAFAQSLPTVRSYFPEYADHKIIGAVASLYVDESIVRQGERLGLIVLGFGEEMMEMLNQPGFRLGEF
jgi:hypothetical protein